MRFSPVMFVAGGVVAGAVAIAAAQQGGQQTPAPAQAAPAAAADPVQKVVDRLDLERYKATIKGLTQFGDRRQGTKRNRDAIDWIEAQLKSYGCTNTERITYTYPSPEASAPARGRAAGSGGQAATGQRAAGAGQQAAGGQRAGGAAQQAARGQRAAGGGGAQGGGRGQAQAPGQWTVRRGAADGSTQFGYRGRSGVNNDPMAQPDEKLRALDSEPTPPGPGERQDVFCTKIGTTRPDEMYIIGAHMDGIGFGEAANDNGSGTAIVMELARIFSSPDVQTNRSIRFILWNNEETGLNGAWAYVNQRRDLQGKESPAGSGRYPEPTWLGMIQHDMMLFDHGMPRPDGTMSSEQRPEADVNIEFQSNSAMADASMKFAFLLKVASDKYNKNYPATVGPHMTNTDSTPFQDSVPTLSMRENERGMQTGAGWNPHWHQPTDVFTTYSDKDFALGLNAAMTTLGAIAQLTGVKIR